MVSRIGEGGDWAVLANITFLAEGIEDQLDSKGRRQIVLPAEGKAGAMVVHLKMYEKGWWKTGTKPENLQGNGGNTPLD